MLASVNARRSRAGLRALTFCAALNETSQGHSNDQAAAKSLGHEGTDGSSLTQRVDASGLGRWTALGENLARGFTTPEAVNRALMASPVHRANLLSRLYTRVGFGAAADETGVLYWTQNFSRGGTC